MMWIFTLFLFLSWNGVLGISWICRFQVHKSCDNETLLSEVPENLEELVEACEKFHEIDQCIINGLKTCDLEPQSLEFDDDEWFIRRRTILFRHKEVCSLKPDLYSKYLSSKDCSNEVSKHEFTKNSCYKALKKVLAALQNRRERLLKTDNATLMYLYDRCLYQLFEGNCHIHFTYKKCGSDAREVAFEVFKNFYDWDELCPLDIRIDVLQLLDYWSSLTRDEIYVKDYLITDTFY